VKGSIRLGFVRGGKSKTIGAFSEYIKQEYDLTAEVPKNITPAQAASAPIPCMWQNVGIALVGYSLTAMLFAVFTACQALYLRLGLPLPGQDTSSVAGKWMLVWSGSTAVGQYVWLLRRQSHIDVTDGFQTYATGMLSSSPSLLASELRRLLRPRSTTSSSHLELKL